VGSGTEKGKGRKEKEKEEEREKGGGKEESEESIRREIQRLRGLLPPASAGDPGPVPNLGPSPAPQSERRHGRSEAHGRNDTFLDEKVEVRPFLMQTFGSNVDPFLDILVPRQDAPFVHVALTATTPWQEKPRTLDYAAFLPTLPGETDDYGRTLPISRATYANVNTVCAPLAHAVKKFHPYMRLLSHPFKLERRRLDVLTGLIVGDETCVFMFPSQTARSASSHVIAVSMWPHHPVGAYNLDDPQPYPTPLTYVLDVGERGLPAIAEQARKAIYNWLQYHPLAIPRQRDTGMITVGRNKEISLTPASRGAGGSEPLFRRGSQRLPRWAP
jgi:hypothetical protein